MSPFLYNPLKYDKDFENFIYEPTTMSLNIRSEAITQEFLDAHPFVNVGKRLSGGITLIYFDVQYYEQISSHFQNFSYNVYPIVMGLLDVQNLEAAGIVRVQTHPYIELSGRGALLGFVDTGIDYTQRAFTYEDGTSKIQYIWDQTIRGNPPNGFPYGTEYNNEKINEALKSSDPSDIVPHKDTVGHGTFLASVAGSREQGNYIGAAPDSEIIAVKLRNAKPYDRERHLIPSWQENAYSTDDFMMGIQYIVDKAAELRRPVAICVALGTNFGSHDSFSITSEYLSNIAGTRGVAICAAAGNESQAAHHTQGKLSVTGETQNIEIRVGDTQGDINLTIWNYPLDRMSVAVKSPSGEQTTRIPASYGIRYQSRLVLEKSTIIIDYAFPVQRSGEQFTRVRILSATPGIWTVTVYGDSVLDGTYHAWLPMTGLVEPGIVFLSPTPNYTTVVPSTGIGVIACGSYNSKNGSLAATSSWGPTRLPSIAPDLVAPGVDVGGIFPTGYGTMSGTSVAAAITTGASAILLQWGIIDGNDPSLDSFRVRAELIGGCSRDPDVEYPNNQWGHGKLDLLGTFKYLRPI